MKKTAPLSLKHLIACILFLQANVCLSQIDQTSKLPVDPKVKIGKLPNGLTYYIRKNVIPEKKVQLRLVVNAGSILEDEKQQGLAHFMEHMNFNGTKNFPKNELVNYLQSIGVQFGADLNAYTGFDETVYILPIPSDDPEKVDKGFTILEDWAGNASLDTLEINKERGIVLEESRLGKGAGERMGKKYYPKLFNGSLYAERLPIGKDDILQNFKSEEVVRFYKTWYRPDLMAVIVVGDIDPAFAEQKIIKHFSQLKNPTDAKPRPSIIPIAERSTSEAMVLVDKEQTNTILQIFNFVEKAKPYTNWTDYRSLLVENLFNSLINQRLSSLTQQANPPFLFANTSFISFLRGYRSFISFAFIGDKPVKQAIDSVITITETVKKFGFLQSELDRAKLSVLNQSEIAFTNKDKTESGRLVQEYISNYLSGTPITGIENSFAFLKQVLPTISLEEVNSVITKMHSNQGKFVLLTAPDKTPSGLPSNEELLTIVASAADLPVKRYEEKAVAKSLMDKLPKKGKITSMKSNTLLGTTDLTLSNGITITLKPTEFKNNEVHMDGWRWGGFRNFSLADKENVENAPRIIEAMGVQDLAPIDLRRYLAGKTANVHPYVNPLEEGIEGFANVKDLETFFQLIHLYFVSPRKDEQLFKSYIATQKGFVQNLKANPQNFFADTLTKIQFGNNPWAQSFPQPSDFDKISLEKTYSIYQKLFANAYGMHFTFTGNIDIKKFSTLLETYLGSLPASPKENKFTDVGLRPVKGVVETTIYKGEDKRGLVNMIFTGEVPYSGEEALRLKILTDVLNIKIIEKLREEMGGIYGGGISSNLTKRPYSNYSVRVSFPCGPENVEKLTNALTDIIRTAQEKGVDQKDLDKVKVTLKKQDEDRMKQNDHWLRTLSHAWIEREDPMWILQYSKKVDELKVEDLRETARKYFNMKNYIKVILNPEKRI